MHTAPTYLVLQHRFELLQLPRRFTAHRCIGLACQCRLPRPPVRLCSRYGGLPVTDEGALLLDEGTRSLQQL